MQFGFWASPFGFALLGVVTGARPKEGVCWLLDRTSFANVIVMLLLGYTLMTLYTLGKKYRANNFPDLCERAWGTKGSIIASILIFVYNWYVKVVSRSALSYLLCHFLYGLVISLIAQSQSQGKQRCSCADRR